MLSWSVAALRAVDAITEIVVALPAGVDAPRGCVGALGGDVRSASVRAALAAASPFLMKDLLGRSSTEYGLYFMLFPAGYFTGNWISGRLSGKVALETMVLIGTLFAAIVIWAQAALIVAGYLTPLLLFLPGGLTSFAQGLSLPNAQAGAMRVVPGIAGTAAGVGVFAQMFLSAVSAEAYGLLADGTALPMVALAVPGIVVALGAACASFILGRRNILAAAAE